MKQGQANKDRLPQGKDCSRQSYCIPAIHGSQCGNRADRDVNIFRVLIYLSLFHARIQTNNLCITVFG